ncbi:MAG: nascent polypeptide-associated complex protein [Candidatus Thermoplasmatota archaeon]|jgi:nascent polypeptide-associated complex subunit alpha|nr:nascent polypeptide-associated complex protein [Candidatus Thermoplasmatota archaeon]MCL5930176.1 nascent polypeptide-associated complex protein [Candidatus Thermoplasmatota archaeon]
MMGGRMNDRQIRRMMQQAGIKSSEMDGVIQVDFIFSDRKISVKGPQVTILDIQGTRTYQVVGGEEVTGDVGGAPKSKDADINEDDLNLVMQKTGVDREKGIEALRKNGYKPAEAIIALMTGK